MATARELLEQADALMRRNRLREAVAADASGDFPMLTDVVATEGGALPLAPATAAPAAATGFAVAPGPVTDIDRPGFADGDVPLLTEIVEDYEPISIIGEPEDAAAAAQWPDFDDGEAAFDESPPVVGAAPSVATPLEAVAAAAPESPDASAPAAPPDNVDLDARWDALAEDVRMQVLQRIDIFTDTGLQEQLTARLQPIVDRASADLVATINQQIGQLLRGYVAEAIEREIEKWRHGGGA